MRKFKLLFLLLLALVMSATSAFAQAVGTTFVVGDITYELTAMDLTTHNNTAVVTYIGGSGAQTVPSTVTHPKNHEMVKITGSKEFTNCASGVTSITFSEGYTTMGKGCYAKSKNLTKVTFPASFTTMGKDCFESNNSLISFEVASGNTMFKHSDQGWLLSKDGTTLHAYPGGITGDVIIPESITTIEATAFNGCKDVRKITIPSTVTSIATGITTSFLAVGTYFHVDTNNPNYKDVDGVLLNKNGDELITFPKDYSGTLIDGKYTVPGTVKTICGEAFSHTSVLPTSIDLNNTETISAQAFNYANGLTSVTIGPKVSSIQDGAFVNCEKITQYEVALDNTTYLSDGGIVYSKNKETLYLCPIAKTGPYEILAETKTVKAKAFYRSKLSSIKFPTALITVEDQAFRFSEIETLDFGTNSHLASIGSSAFGNTKLHGSLTIPASVATLSLGAFNYTKLTDVHIADGSQLNAITYQAFANMPDLETFTFNGSAVNMKRIDDQAFANDPKLKRLDVPASVTIIGKGAFLNTPALETVTFQTPSQIKEIREGAFGSCGIKYITLPDGVTNIQQQAFDNCANLTTITIPASVTSIGTGTFNFCENLTSIQVDANNPNYSSLDGMLANKEKTKLVVFPAGKANTKFAIVPNVTAVEPYAFYGSEKITTITFPKTVTSIGQRAIALCKNLKSFSFMGEENVPTLTKDIMYESGNVKDITVFVRKKWYENSANQATINNYNNTFKEVHPSFVTQTGYDRGTEFFPTSMTDAGVISFYTPRTSVIIPAKVKEDTKDAVRNKTWNGEYNVSSVLDFAYENESKVEDIVFLADIGVIGLNAFKAGTQLKGIYFVGNTPALLSSTDYQQPDSYPFKAGQAIYVKESKVNEYKTKWEVDGNTLGITHKIPQETHQFGGTVCFPFDVKYPSGQGSNDIKPYVPMDYTHAYDTSNPFVKAYSVDNYYVPAFVGALIRSKEAVTVNSYCEMDETQAHDKTALTALGYSETDNNCMIGAVEDTPITNETGYQYYAFRKSTGKFVKLNNGANFPHFKAYFRLADNAAAPAKEFKIVFDDAMVTGIDGIIDNTAADKADEPYYNLNGMQVVRPSKGVYIRGGKKVIIK